MTTDEARALALNLKLYASNEWMLSAAAALRSLAEERDAERAHGQRMREHARGASKREDALQEQVAKGKSTIQSFKDRIANATAERDAAVRKLDALREACVVEDAFETDDVYEPTPWACVVCSEGWVGDRWPGFHADTCPLAGEGKP